MCFHAQEIGGWKLEPQQWASLPLPWHHFTQGLLSKDPTLLELPPENVPAWERAGERNFVLHTQRVLGSTGDHQSPSVPSSHTLSPPGQLSSSFPESHSFPLHRLPHSHRSLLLTPLCGPEATTLTYFSVHESLHHAHSRRPGLPPCHRACTHRP